MTRFLYPRTGKGQVTLGGVVFTDGVAEADLGPHTADYLEMLGATIVRSEDDLNESTVEELEQQLRQGGFRFSSTAHKADLVRILRGEPVQAPTPPKKRTPKPKPEEPAGDVETPPVDADTHPTEIDPEPSVQHGPEGDEDHEEDTAWPDTPASPSTPTTSDSPSPEEPTPSNSPDASPEPPAES